MNKLEEIKTKISANQEVLATLPQNNKKNIKSYIEKINELIKEFSEYDRLILKEIEKRYNKLKNIKENKDINKSQIELKYYEGILYLLNDIKTSYEKMDLDKLIQNLTYYYKKNIEIVNENIKNILNKFEEVGINLEEKDFIYSNYAKEYIDTFLWELKNGDINSKKIKAKFEEIYWKCPNIITHIELNFRYLYLKHEKVIDKYYIKQKEELLKEFTSEQIIDRYLNLKRQYLEKQKEDKAIIINNLLNGELNIKEYSKTAMKNNYLKFVSADTLEKADKNEMNEININLIKLLNIVEEYSIYIKYKFIIDDIKKIYEEKNQYKKIYNQTKKQISKKEQKLISLSKQIGNKRIFKSSTDEVIAKQDELILELKQLYKDLDNNKIYNKITTQVNDNTHLKEVLYLASSFYKYLFTYIRDNKNGMLDEEIEKMIKELEQDVNWSYFTILDNITISDNKDIALIIKDRYNLLNINITTEDLDENNLERLIETLEKIETNYYIIKNQINIEEIEELLEFQKILMNK